MPQTEETATPAPPTVSSSASVPLGERTGRQETALVFSTGRTSRRFASFRRRAPRVEEVRSDRCLNCGTYPLVSRYCPDCGQENVSFKVPLPMLLQDVGEEFIKWDGRLARTILFLLFKPGALTEQYNLGRRTQFLPPFKMYFVASALFVALMSLLHPMTDDVNPTLDSKVSKAVRQVEADITKEAKKNAPARHAKVLAASSPVAAPSTGIAAKKNATSNDDFTFNVDDIVNDGISLGGYRLKLGDLKYNDHTAERGQYVAAFDQWLARLDKLKKPRPPYWKTELMRYGLRMVDHPGSLGSNFVENLGKGIFFLMPAYAFLLALFFRSAKRFYIEHLIFAVHLHTFAFTLGVIFQLVRLYSHPGSDCVLLLYPVYEFLSLRKVYGNGKRKTLFKQWLMNQFYGWVLLLGFAIIFAFTVAFL